MKIKTHRDNWSDITTIGRAQLYRDRYKDVAVDLGDPEVRAELVRASASKSIEVHEGEREQLEAHGLTVTAAGAVVELKTVEPRDLEPGEQLAEGDLPPGATSEPADPPDGDDDDQDGDEDDDEHEAAPAAAAPAASSSGGRRVRKGKGRARVGGRA